MESSEARIEYYRKLLRPLVAGQPWVLFAEPLAALRDLVASVRALGVERVLALAAFRGTGEVPEGVATQLMELQEAREDTSHSFHVFESALAQPPAAVQAEIDAWDPERAAFAAGSVVLGHLPQVARRRHYGCRQPAWMQLEDKTVVARFFERCGLRTAASDVVPAKWDDLQRATEALDRGQGCVWAGDARDYIHGGGNGTRWVRTERDCRELAEWFGRRHARVRVMPFIEGVPCSIHGLVLKADLVVLRPIEMVILQEPNKSEFVYAGFDSFWQPSASDWQDMRQTACRVGDGLRQQLDYRGPYTIDGIMSADGFLPTELNTRVGGAMSLYEKKVPGFPFYPLMWAAIEGEALAYRPRELEHLLLETLETAPSGRSHGLVPNPNPFGEETRSFWVASKDGTYELEPASSDDNPTALGTLTLGPGSAGAFMGFVPNPETTPRGPSVAPLTAQAWSLASRQFGLGLGPLEPARPVR